MTQPQQRRKTIAWFDARSVMLFAAIAIGATAVGAQAQTTSSPQPPDKTRSGAPVIGPASGDGQTKLIDQANGQRERALKAMNTLDGYQ